LTVTIKARELAQSLLNSVIPHLDHGPSGLWLYAGWVKDWPEWLNEPTITKAEFRSAIACLSRELLSTSNSALLCSAIQALAITGDANDLLTLSRLTSHNDENVRLNAFASVEHIEHRMKTLNQFFEEVKDCRTFLAFVGKLAETVESDRSTPVDTYTFKRANCGIEDFLYSSLSYFEDDVAENMTKETPTWRKFAEMLLQGYVEILT
jgi:hypothetical protein